MGDPVEGQDSRSESDPDEIFIPGSGEFGFSVLQDGKVRVSFSESLTIDIPFNSVQ